MTRFLFALVLLVVCAAAHPLVAQEPQTRRDRMISIHDLDPEIKADGSDETEKIREALKIAVVEKRTVFFPAGTYGVSGNILTLGTEDSLQIKGDGINATQFKLLQDTEEPIFLLRGGEKYEPPFETQSWFVCEDVMFQGGKKRGSWFRCEFVSHAYFTRCFFGFIKGPAISGFGWWDTTFNECSFVGCGDAEKKQAAVILQDSKEPTHQGYCNNICFNTCRFEFLPHDAIYMGFYARKNRVVSCKFDKIGNNGVYMRKADSNIVMASQFIACEQSAVVLDGAEGSIVMGNIVGLSGGAAVRLSSAKENVITGNAFGVGREKPNQRGNIVGDRGSTKNQIRGNMPE